MVLLVIEPDEEGFHAYAPALKGLHVDGRNEQEAEENAFQAITVYLDSLIRNSEYLPIGPDFTRRDETLPTIPIEANLRRITFQWPSLQVSGIS